MDFDLGSSSTYNFPKVKIENRFKDDAHKLHSDLIGVSLDFNPGTTTTSQKEGREKENETELRVQDLEVEEDEEFYQYSLPITNIRKGRRVGSKVIWMRARSNFGALSLIGVIILVKSED